MYKKIFAIDEIPLKERGNLKVETNPYLLKNYFFLGPKLDKEFYYNYYVRKILFDLDVMELDDFITFQFENSDNPERMLKLLELKILPDIDKIISNAVVTGIALKYRDEIELGYGCVETNGVIKNKQYDFQVFYALTAANKLNENLKQRKTILRQTIDRIEKLYTEENPDKLRWIGKPSHLALIIQTLVDEGYIAAPKANNHEVNKTHLARQIINSFSSKENLTNRNLRKFLSFDDIDGEKLRESFNNNGLYIPNSGEMG